MLLLIVTLNHWQALIQNMIQLDHPIPGKILRGGQLPPDSRPTRGVFGHAMGYYVAHETSKAGHQHSHFMIHVPVTWNKLGRLDLRDGALNERVGAFFDSVITTHLPLDGDNPAEADWIGLQEIFNTDPVHLASMVTNNPESIRNTNAIACRREDHKPHNHSCYPDRNPKPGQLPGDIKCRFGLPSKSFDQKSGLVQAEVMLAPDRFDRQGNPFPTELEVKLLKIPTPFPDQNHLSWPFTIDKRILLLMFNRPTTSSEESRHLPSQHDSMGDIPYLTDDDPDSRNNWISDFSMAVMKGCSGTHNNVQFVARVSMGLSCYISKIYMVKGSGQSLLHTLSLLAEAYTRSRTHPSVHPDLNENPLRPALRTLQRLINNKTKANEYSLRLIISSLLGMPQFESSHRFKSIWVHSARQQVLNRLRDTTVYRDALEGTTDVVEIDEEAPGELARRGVGADATLVRVDQATDYSYRHHDLANYSLQEFVCCLLKVTKDRSAAAGNATFDFVEGHPQYRTHTMRLQNFCSIPLLAGQYVPKFPGSIPETRVACQTHLKKDFASFFLTLLCPWDVTTLVPRENLSWETFVVWFLEASESEDPVLQARASYVNNCIDAMFTSPIEVKATELVRKRNADTMDQFLQRRASEAASSSHIGQDYDPAEIRQEGNGDSIDRTVNTMRLMLEFNQSTAGNTELNQNLFNEWLLMSLAPLLHSRVSSSVPVRVPAIALLQSEHIATYFSDISTLRPPMSMVSPPSHSTGNNRLDGSREASIFVPADLNQEQSEIYTHIATKHRRGETFHQLIVGKPGTGKSHLTKKILTLFGEEAVVCAMMGKAATAYPGGQTVHSLFGLSSRPIFVQGNVSSPLIAKLRTKFNGKKLLVIEEVSMLTTQMLMVIDSRLKIIHNNNCIFGGISVLFLGDFLQQLPILKNLSLIPAVVTGSVEGEILKKFCCSVLLQQCRSQDIFHTRMIDYMSNLDILYPFSESFLDSTCQYCCPMRNQLSAEARLRERLPSPRDHAPSDEHCPPQCPHRCQHFKVLNQLDIDTDPSWLDSVTRKFITSSHKTADAINLSQLQQLAINLHVPVIRWRLPCTDTGSYDSTLIDDSTVDKKYDMWGYFVATAPVSLHWNINVSMGLAHGTAGHLHSIVPNDENAYNLSLGAAVAGQVITIACPKAVNVEIMPTAYLIPSLIIVEGKNVVTIPNGATAAKSMRTVKIKINNVHVTNAISPGYDITFAMTFFGIQGETISKILMNCNKDPYFPAGHTMQSVYVGASRVALAANFRICPWQNGYSHIRELHHSEQIIAFFNVLHLSYNRVILNADDVSRRSSVSGTLRSRSNSTAVSRRGPRCAGAAGGGIGAASGAPRGITSHRGGGVSGIGRGAGRGRASVSARGDSASSNYRSSALTRTYSRWYVPFLREVFEYLPNNSLGDYLPFWPPNQPTYAEAVTGVRDIYASYGQLTNFVTQNYLSIGETGQLDYIEAQIQNLLLGDYEVRTDRDWQPLKNQLRDNDAKRTALITLVGLLNAALIQMPI